MNRTLYLPIEIIAREFDAKCLIAHRALARGYDVIMARTTKHFRQLIINRQPGIYFDKSLPFNPETYKNLKDAGIVPVALDEEGLVITQDEDYRSRVLPEALESMPLFFAWGQNNRRMILKYAQNKITSDNIKITGSPRLDLLRPGYNDIFKKRAEKIIKKHDRFVLINSNFVFGNLHPDYGDLIEYLTNLHRIKSAEDEAYYRNAERYKFNLLDNYVDLVKKLSAEFPEINFIVRPHPSERAETWHEKLGKINNVKCIFEGSANEWIYASEGLIHSGCTTGIEAWIMRKPVIRYNPQAESEYEPELPNRFGVYASSYNEVASYIKKLIKGQLGDTFKSQLPLASEYMESLEGDLAADKIMDHIDSIELSQSRRDVSGDNKCDSVMLKKIKSFLSHHYYSVKAIKQMNSKKDNLKFKKFPGITKKMIDENLTFFNGLSENKVDYYIENIHKNVLLIGRK